MAWHISEGYLKAQETLIEARRLLGTPYSDQGLVEHLETTLENISPLPSPGFNWYGFFALLDAYTGY